MTGDDSAFCNMTGFKRYRITDTPLHNRAAGLQMGRYFSRQACFTPAFECGAAMTSSGQRLEKILNSHKAYSSSNLEAYLQSYIANKILN